MIYFRFIGRMGNQMFQYACANELAELYNTIVIWDDVDNNIFFKYFKRNKTRHIRTRNRVFRKVSRLLMGLIYGRSIPIIRQNGNEPINEVKKEFSNPGYYEGFFQSEYYFMVTKSSIFDYFKLKRTYINEFTQKYGRLYNNNKILVIHCRLGDYKNWEPPGLGGKNLILPMTYYYNAIKNIADITDYHIMVVTDDVNEAKEKFKDFYNVNIISDEEIIDFQLMMNADKLIISNSSFSWWAAYLNTKASIIYAPEYWVGFKIKQEWPSQIISERFTKVSVF